MSDAANRIVQKLWSYCHVLRDDGLSYQDYLEQLTFLLFLKMADERERLTGVAQPIPADYRWERLAAPAMEGAELERHYRETLRVLGGRGGMLGLIFEKAQNRIQDPAKLRLSLAGRRGEGPPIRGWRRWRRRGRGRLRQRGYVPTEPCRIGRSGR
ncbi:MAG: type I restriction-modification system subunit M N-terminal domain-containing protein [Acidobacteria bacterium]|nr:type I restriction-modification system subunit M N-terminal domain-containing protein [Acidobacteriota bacterium]